MLPKQPNQGLIDGISCLQGVISRGQNVGVRELSRMLELDPTRVHRLLKTFSHLGMLQQDEKGKYGPGPGIHALAAQALYASHFFQDAIGPLERLRKNIPHIVAMGVLWNRLVSYFYHAKRGTPISRAVGSFGVWDAAESGVGIAVLTGMEDERIRQTFKNHPMPYYENGIDDLIGKVHEARKLGYATGQVSKVNKTQTIAKRLEANPNLAVGISGVFAENEFEDLVELLNSVVQEIDHEVAQHKERPPVNSSPFRL